MEQLASFKKSLEHACLITEWNPSSAQLLEIARLLAARETARNSDVVNLVSRICPGTSFIFTEGVDNSDLNTLLTMAIQVASRRS